MISQVTMASPTSAQLEKPVVLPPSCTNKGLLNESAPWEDLHKGSLQKIFVDKRNRQLYLVSTEGETRKYNVSLGFTPEGAKVSEGDGKTPEGSYIISSKNPQSAYHLALRTSYPNAQDLAFARQQGLKPGHSIMIHGFPNAAIAFKRAQSLHGIKDWTEGCIAVTNEEIEEIFPLVQEKTLLEICP